MERILNVTLVVVGVLFAMAATLWLSSPAHAVEPDLKQETLDYCNARAALALNITRAMEQGYTTAQINIGWEQPPESEEMAEGREQWVAALKQEIDEAAKLIPPEKDEWAQRVAQKVIEKCWYEYGKKRVGGKHTAAPVTFGFIHTASSEAIAGPPAGRVEHCSEVLSDQVYIGNMLGGERATADELRGIAANSVSAGKLSEERLSVILPLIDAAEAAQKTNALQAWFDAYWSVCMAGRL